MARRLFYLLTFVLAFSALARADLQSAGAADTLSAQVQLEAGEFDAAKSLALRDIEEIEVAGTMYDRALVEPLRILGDAYVGLDDTQAALNVYERARYVLRMNEGLNTTGQVHLLHREAEIFLQRRDLAAANDRYETAYEVILSQHGRTSALVPEHVRLADWYRSNHILPVAHTMYREAIEILEDDESADEYALGAILPKDWAHLPGV